MLKEFFAESVDLNEPRENLVMRVKALLRSDIAKGGVHATWCRDRLDAIDAAEFHLARDFDITKVSTSMLCRALYLEM